MFFKSNLFEKPMHVEITHYQRDILKNISAEILFALISPSYYRRSILFYIQKSEKTGDT